MSRHKKPCPTPIEYRNVSFYNMKDLDLLSNVLSVTEIVARLSSQFNTKQRYFWIHPASGIIESVPTCEWFERKYASAVSNWAEWKYDLYSKPIERPVLTPFDVH